MSKTRPGRDRVGSNFAEATSLIFPRHGEHPNTTTPGSTYYNTTKNVLFIYNGEFWTPISKAPSSIKDYEKEFRL